MAEKHEEGVGLAAVLAQQNQLLAQNAEMIAALKGSQPPRIVNFGDADYQAALAKDRKAWKTPVYQNGYEADPAGESDETIDRVSKLRAGRYIGGSVEVHVSPKGAINFSYKNKTPDQRFARMLEFRTFAELVNRIWDEMAAATPVAVS